MKFSAHVAHMCLKAPASCCVHLHAERHMKDAAAQTKWTDDSLDAWGCCQRKSEQKSNATLNTQLVFTGREQECKECLPSEFVPEWKVLIKRVPGNLWNCLNFRGWMLGIPIFLFYLNGLYECLTWDSRSPVQAVSTYSMCVQTFAAEVHCRPCVKEPTVIGSQRQWLNANMLN